MASPVLDLGRLQQCQSRDLIDQVPLLSVYGTYKTVKARFWPWLEDSQCQILALHRLQQCQSRDLIDQVVA